MIARRVPTPGRSGAGPDALKVSSIPGKNHGADLSGCKGYKNIVSQSCEACGLKPMSESQLLENLPGLKPNPLVRRKHPIQPVKGTVEPLQSSTREAISGAGVKLREDHTAHIEQGRSPQKT